MNISLITKRVLVVRANWGVKMILNLQKMLDFIEGKGYFLKMLNILAAESQSDW